MRISNKITVLSLIAIFMANCTKLESETKLRIIISYAGSYQFSSPTQLKLSRYANSGTDGPSTRSDIAVFSITHVPQVLNVESTSNPIDPQAGIYASLESLGSNDLHFEVFSEDHDSKSLTYRAMESLGHGFSRDITGVYQSGSNLLAGCDPKTFAFIKPEGEYVRDARHVYHDSEIIADADVNTFEQMDANYQRDATRIYFKGQALAAADRSTFEVLPMAGFGRDKIQIFLQGQTLVGADPATFTPLTDRFSKDKAAAFFNQSKIPGADGASFHMLGSSYLYAADAKSVFHEDQPLTGADPDKFTVLERNVDDQPVMGLYAKDAASVYFRGELIEGADAASFQVVYIGNVFGGFVNEAKDKNRSYNGKVPRP